MPRINLLPWREALRKKRQKDFVTHAGLALIGAASIALLVHMVVQGQIDRQVERNAYLEKTVAELDKNKTVNLLGQVAPSSRESAEATGMSTGGNGSPGLQPGANAQGGTAIERFCEDFTAKARAGKIDPVFGIRSNCLCIYLICSFFLDHIYITVRIFFCIFIH